MITQEKEFNEAIALAPQVEERWTLEISPKVGLFDIRLGEVWNYRDLLVMFVRRDFLATYKQTILGPLWFVVQPLLTTFVFIAVFSRAAKIPTDGASPVLFYLSGLSIWNLFSNCLTRTSNTFTGNAAIFGKVYFPRLIVPLTSVISSLITFGIQFSLVLAVLAFQATQGHGIQANGFVLFLPVLLAIAAALGLGAGIIVSAATTKYRDLSLLVGFGVQLFMYATPVFYPLSFLSGGNLQLANWNPLSVILENYRHCLLGTGKFDPVHLMYSGAFSLVLLVFGVIVFNQVEKNFVDIV